MTKEELEKRKERAERETFIISKTDAGYRVYSPERPTISYTVSGSSQNPTCSCPDFETHSQDPEWRCKHILAVANQFRQGGNRNGEGDSHDRKERLATQNEAAGGNGIAQMLLKRSVSPDGKIDSLSVEFSIPVGIFSAREIREEALEALGLQSQIVEGFLGESRNGNGQATKGNGHDEPSDGSVPAQMLTIGGMDGKWGRRLFIRVQANGRTLNLYGNRKQLAEAVAAAGFTAPDEIFEGMTLNLPCRVVTKPTEDGRYLNIEKVLPTGRARQ